MPDAPHLSSPMAVEPAWIDYNGHLNMAYYNVMFDRAVDEFVSLVGLGPAYVATRSMSIMTAEIHVCYLREIFLETPVRLRLRALDVDATRLHVFSELIHAEEGWVSATSEQMLLHVDLRLRKTAPWPADVREGLDALKAASDALGAWPERVGRKIGIRRG